MKLFANVKHILDETFRMSITNRLTVNVNNKSEKK